MPYYQTEIKAGKTIEIYRGYSKRIGKQSRGERKSKTPEEMEKANRRQAEKKLTRLLNANFVDGDLHVVLTYKKDARPSPEEAREILKKLWRRLKAKYKKAGEELKYVVTTEYLNKSIHHHVVVNNPEGMNVAKLLRELWDGIPKITPLWSGGQYKELAAYLIKETEKTFRGMESGVKQRYSRSRNLVIPKPKTKLIKRSMGWNKNPRPKKGYYIDQDTLVNGICPFTCREYQSYTMIEIPSNKLRGKPKNIVGEST